MEGKGREGACGKTRWENGIKEAASGSLGTLSESPAVGNCHTSCQWLPWNWTLFRQWTSSARHSILSYTTPKSQSTCSNSVLPLPMIGPNCPIVVVLCMLKLRAFPSI
eukprot:166065-Chlamydomonas_euryale.AAC.1